jgi:hypothetical protein
LGNFAAGISYSSYDTWNIGIGFTYKVFTLDIRYSDIDLSKGNCNAFTSTFNTSGTNNVTPINPTGAGSNWWRGGHRQTFRRPYGDDQPEVSTASPSMPSMRHRRARSIDRVAACAAAVANCLDLCGDQFWMRQTIDARKPCVQSASALASRGSRTTPS